jgi:hypothetical protein
MTAHEPVARPAAPSGELPLGQRRVEGFPRFGTELWRPAPPIPADPVITVRVTTAGTRPITHDYSSSDFSQRPGSSGAARTQRPLLVVVQAADGADTAFRSGRNGLAKSKSATSGTWCSRPPSRAGRPLGAESAAQLAFVELEEPVLVGADLGNGDLVEAGLGIGPDRRSGSGP